MVRGNAYAATKAALEAHAMNLAAELAGTGVTVNVYRPGGLDTARARNGLFRAGLDVVFRVLETGRVMLKLPPTWGSATEIPGTKVTSVAPSCLTKAARPPTQ